MNFALNKQASVSFHCVWERLNHVLSGLFQAFNIHGLSDSSLAPDIEAPNVLNHAVRIKVLPTLTSEKKERQQSFMPTSTKHTDWGIPPFIFYKLLTVSRVMLGVLAKLVSLAIFQQFQRILTVRPKAYSQTALRYSSSQMLLFNLFRCRPNRLLLLPYMRQLFTITLLIVMTFRVLPSVKTVDRH